MNKIEQIARVCHSANVAYCRTLGDDSHNVWESAPDWQRETVAKGVEFHLDNPGALPSASHESWLTAKQREGWRYGEEKDQVKKTHPCFMPFKELPREQQLKDVLLSAIVNALRELV
jgi:hypothetical protein